MASNLQRLYYPHTGFSRILVKPNQVVHQGDVLYVLTRLGIPNEVKAKHDGIVTEVNLGPIGRLAQCDEHVLTLKYELSAQEIALIEEEKRLKFQKAPWEASYYLTPEPNTPPLVQLGDYVKKGQRLCVAMIAKQAKDVLADLEGRVERIYFDRGDVVKKGERLFGFGK